VKELMGHKTFQMTERYSHVGNGTLQKAVRTLENALGEIQPTKSSKIQRKKLKRKSPSIKRER